MLICINSFSLPTELLLSVIKPLLNKPAGGGEVKFQIQYSRIKKRPFIFKVLFYFPFRNWGVGGVGGGNFVESPNLNFGLL
jgi:hypothetical protein